MTGADEVAIFRWSSVPLLPFLATAVSALSNVGLMTDRETYYAQVVSLPRRAYPASLS